MTTIAAIKKEIEKLKNSILWVHEPVCKAFIVGADEIALMWKRSKPTGKLTHIQEL
jgi:hypothetical protein